MATQAWMDSSLRRSGRLGLEVLERASRRSVDRPSTGASQTPTMPDEDAPAAAKRTHLELQNAFTSIAEFMGQTGYHCKMFYESGRCTEPSEAEKTHIFRFHAPSEAATSAVQRRKLKGHIYPRSEDFYIDVSPGTYAITASLPNSQQQTQLVSVKPGESVDLTFNL